ncbi:uncharacterized protein [Diadema antillarum]|uniref:uncharacterized protein n=1 Tax=Diadema antillarum TaxID=105358 RepID=UPI003A86D79A
MTTLGDADSFFDFDGDRDQKPALKGEYNRGSTPPSWLKSSPHPPNSDSKHSKKSDPSSSSPVHSRPSTSGNFTAESDAMSRRKDSPYSNSYGSRSRSRSRSPSYRRSTRGKSRSRSRSPSYSDSFDSEDSRQDSRRASPVRTKKSTRGRNTTTTNRNSHSNTSKDSRSSYRSYATTYTRSTKILKKAPPKKKGGRGGRSQSVSTVQQSPRSTEVTRRMLSAKGHTINRLRSDFDELQRKYDDAVRELKLVKQLQRRQEVALSKFEDSEEQLPQLLRNHAAEVDSLRERLRRAQDKERERDRRLKERNEEINRLTDEVKKLRRISEDKHLLDRDKLQRKVDRLTDSVDEKDKKIQELERYVDHMKKNHRHETDQTRHQDKELRRRVIQLDEENQSLKYQLREKEKELDIRNIYSNRIMKPHGKLNSISPPPIRPLKQTRATSNDDLKKTKQTPHPPPAKRSSSAEEKRKSDPEPSPRAKPVKAEEKKVAPPPPKRELSEHEKILLELDAGSKPLSQPPNKEVDILKQLDAGIKKRERADEDAGRRREREALEEKRRLEREEEERRRAEEEKRKQREKEEEERKRREENERNAHETDTFKPSFTSSQRDSPDAPYRPSFSNNAKNSGVAGGQKPVFGAALNRAGGEKDSFGTGVGRRGEDKKPLWLMSDSAGPKQGTATVIFGERERKQKEEEAAHKKSSTFVTTNNAPKTPTFDDDDDDSDEADIPFFGSKPKAPAPSKASNSFAVNSVRDLQRYSSNRAGSAGKPDSREDDERRRKEEEEEMANQRRKQKEESERLAEERRKKDLLLAKMKEIDTGKPDSRGSKKEYKFPPPVENLHNGKPSHPDLLGSPSSGGKQRKAAEESSTFGGYAPSFGRRAAAGDKPAAKKGGLFDDDDDDDFFSTPKVNQSDKKADLISNLFSGSDSPNAPASKNRSSLEGTVFSTSTKAKPVADSAALPWEKTTPKGPISQPNKPNGISVNVPNSSFDDFDDDIEEVIL